MTAPLAGVAVLPEHESLWRVFMAQFLASKLAVVGLAMLLLFLALAVFAPWIAPQSGPADTLIPSRK